MEKEVTFTMREMKRYRVIQALLEKKMTAGEAASAFGWQMSLCPWTWKRRAP
ncbi:MAG: hypothetical protein JRG73_00590 [Deltaproteobacteria bacterium]|nr:hypothetical protein [Deltaproteobacteria bacterium]MBW2305402.1 hypothetical protein [Deltaproteobacteria bacterium]